VLGDGLEVGHGLGEHERVGPGQRLAHARGEVLRRDHAAAIRPLQRLKRRAPFPAGRRHLGEPRCHLSLVFDHNGMADLFQGHLRVSHGEASRGDVPHGHARLQRVDVDHVDRRVRRRPVAGLDPRHVAVHDQDHVRGGEQRVLPRRVELVPGVQRVVRGEVQAERGGLEHWYGEQLGQGHQLRHRRRVTAQVRRDDQRTLRRG